MSNEKKIQMIHREREDLVGFIKFCNVKNPKRYILYLIFFLM